MHSSKARQEELVQGSARSAQIRGALAAEGLRYRNLPVRIVEPDQLGAARWVPDSKVLLTRESGFLEAHSLFFALLRHSVLNLRNFPSQDCKLRRLVPGKRRHCDPVEFSSRAESRVGTKKPQFCCNHAGCSYSYLNACTGSSFAARLAGYKPESRLSRIENTIASSTSHHGTDQICSGLKCCRLR